MKRDRNLMMIAGTKINERKEFVSVWAKKSNE